MVFSANIKTLHCFIFVIYMLLQFVESDENTVPHVFRSSNNCSLPLTVLDFIYNYTQPDLETIWPCEVRFYWLSLRSFVKSVRFLLTYVTPFIIVLGVLLNTVSFGMLTMSVFYDSSLSLHLKALAVSDNGALIFNYAVGIAKSHFTFINNLFMNSRFLCAMNSVTMELFQFTSTWLVVSLTWTRVFAVVSPFGIYNHNRSAAISITSLICISFVVSLTKLYSGGYETDSVFEFVPCQKKIKPWGSAMYFYVALSTWLPLLFVFIGNVLLIAHMKKSNKIHNQLTHNFGHKANKVHQTSRTLFAVSVVHLILLLPLGVVETLELYWDVILIKYPSTDTEENMRYIHWLKEKMLLKWCRGLFFHIYHWNFAINFFLYYLTGEKFRSTVTRELKNYKNAICSKYAKFLSCFKCLRHLTLMQSSNTLLIRAITFSEQSIDSETTESNTRIPRIT